MTVVYSTTVKNARMQAVADAIDSGSGPGVLQIGTAGMVSTLVTITLQKPCATVANGVLTFAGLPLEGTGSATGESGAARFRTSAGADVVTGLTVNETVADLIIDSVDISPGQTVRVTSGVLRQA